MTTQTSPTQERRKKQRIRYELKKSSYANASQAIDYLDSLEYSSFIEQEMSEAVRYHITPRSISKDHPDYERIVIESINYHICQLNLLRDISGLNPESLKNFQNANQPQYQYPQPVPVPQPVPSRQIQDSTPVSQQVQQPAQTVLVESESMPELKSVDTQVGDRDKEAKEIKEIKEVKEVKQEPKSDSASVSSNQVHVEPMVEEFNLDLKSIPIPTTHQELEDLLDKLSKSIDLSKSTASDLSCLISDLDKIQPSDDEEWSDEMWWMYEEKVRDLSDLKQEKRLNATA